MLRITGGSATLIRLTYRPGAHRVEIHVAA